MRRITRWFLLDIVKMIVATLLNKYDMFMVIEGGTGIGKSTLAYQIARRVSFEFKKLYRLDEEAIEYYYNRVGERLGMTEQEFLKKILILKNEEKYTFKARKILVYTQDDLQKHLISWQSIAIPDEMINVTFNRDFYSEKQKDIIKMMNMFRDHENLTIACVPNFSNLDTQIRYLCKLKITVKKRGTAIVHIPNKVIYSKDKWDTLTNEKIERKWVERKVKNPNYSKLTTFRGMLKFPPLSKRVEKQYQKIKNEKRNIVLKEEMKIKLTDERTPFQKALDKLIDGKIRNSNILDGIAISMDITPDNLKGKLQRELKKMGKPHLLSHYYWDNKGKSEREAQSQNISALEGL